MPWETLQTNQAGLTTVTVQSADFAQINDSTRVLTLLPANANRRSATIVNETDVDIPISEAQNPSWNIYTIILSRGHTLTLDFPASTAALAAYLFTIPNGRILITERA